MKKYLLSFVLVLMASVVVGLSSCDKFKKSPAAPAETDSVAVTAAKLTVDYAVGFDREYMYLHYGSGYRWYETQVTLKDFLDTDSVDGTVEIVTNVFQVVSGSEEGGMDVHVLLSEHRPNGSVMTEYDGFWIEDWPLNDEQIKLSFKDAFDRMMQANYTKPHSRTCTLRKEVGPKPCNPQYIFGNVRSQLYVDAVTGEVTDKSPSFNVAGLEKPLGEWP